MKTFRILIILTLALTSFSACETENGDIFVQWFVDYKEGEAVETLYPVTVNVNNSSLVSSLIDPYSDQALFPDGAVGNRYQVRTNFLIYNNQNELVDQFTVFRSTFNESANYTLELPNGSYTAVAVTDVSYDNVDNVWKIVDQNNINTLRITFANQYVADKEGIVAARRQSFQVADNQATLNLTPAHLGACYVLYFYNFNYTAYQYLYYKFDIDPDDYQLTTQAYSRKLTMYRYSELDFEKKYSGYYVYAYLLPKSNLVLQYVTMDVNKNYITAMKSATFSVGVNQHRQFSVDVTNFSTSTTALAPPAQGVAPAALPAERFKLNKAGYLLNEYMAGE